MNLHMSLVQKTGISLLVLTVFFAFGYAVQHTLSCLLLSFVLAYLFDPFILMLEKKGVRRVYGILILYSFLTILAFFCIIFLFPLLNIRWGLLLHELPGYFQRFKAMASDLKGRFGPAYAAEEWQWLLNHVQAGADRLLAKLGAGMYEAASSVVFNLFNVLLAPILVFFMLYYKREAMEGILRWLPSSNRDFLVAVGHDINRSIGGFLRGQVAVSAIVAFLSTVAMIFLHVNHPLFSGIFAGIASIIPFIGVILATIPPLFFAYAEYQNGVMLLQICAVFSAIYFFEGYVIKPLIFKESMDLNPLVTIIMIMILGELLGFWGILLAIPITGAIKIYCHHLRIADENNDV
ncbi:MAG: AI-2E family transporter [Geobacteraceae bacterium]